MKKVHSILLIDDSDATNFFNKTIISRSNCAEEIIIAKHGGEALELLKTGIVPELIFLDINMPVMNGWEFLSEYQKLTSIKEQSIIFLMIGTPLLEDDKKQYQDMPFVQEFKGKMLTQEVIKAIVSQNFCDRSMAV